MNEYKLQTTTIWSFPNRGNWSTHKGDYRGNWSPHIPKNLILKYTKQGDTVLDCFLGSGTTAIECKLSNRNSIGIDINPTTIDIAKQRLNFKTSNLSKHIQYLGDARNLNMLENDSIDFICTHPPYANIIKYSENIENDISLLEYNKFLDELHNVALELFRVLKSGHLCSFMIGDIRKHGNNCLITIYTIFIININNNQSISSSNTDIIVGARKPLIDLIDISCRFFFPRFTYLTTFRIDF